MKLSPILLFVCCLLISCEVAAQSLGRESLRLDQLRVKGTHNSYHKRPRIALHPRHRYQQDPLFVQLEYLGVRAMELDVHLGRKGFEVYHIALIDSRSQCPSFAECLNQIRAWSSLDRDHEPLMIWIEIKDFAGGWKIETARALDALIRSTFSDRLMTPDDVRGTSSSMREALQTTGWPTLEESRGKILFMLTADDDQLEDYTDGYRDLRGRVMFAEARPDQFDSDWATVAKISADDEADILHAKRQHLLITSTTCTAERSETRCESNRRLAQRARINILLDDFVRPTPERTRFLDLGRDTVGAIVPDSETRPQAGRERATDPIRRAEQAPTPAAAHLRRPRPAAATRALTGPIRSAARPAMR